jgi:hypothetical protein
MSINSVVLRPTLMERHKMVVTTIHDSEIPHGYPPFLMTARLRRQSLLSYVHLIFQWAGEQATDLVTPPV